MWDEWRRVTKSVRKATVKFALPAAPALAVFGLLFLTGTFGLAPDKDYVVKLGFWMLVVAVFIMYTAVDEFKGRIEELEKKAKIRY